MLLDIYSDIQVYPIDLLCLAFEYQNKTNVSQSEQKVNNDFLIVVQNKKQLFCFHA